MFHIFAVNIATKSIGVQTFLYSNMAESIFFSFEMLSIIFKFLELLLLQWDIYQTNYFQTLTSIKYGILGNKVTIPMRLFKETFI